MKKILGCLLVMAVFVVGLSNAGTMQNVKAAKKTVTRSINMRQSDNTIAGIDAPTSTKDTAESWNGDYIYFGKYDGKPVKFRVLNQRETNFGDTTLLLDSDAILKQMKFGSGVSSVSWGSSLLKTWLNGTSSGQFLEAFTAQEQNAIVASTKASAVGAGDFPTKSYKYVALTENKVFALDASEANYAGYGYANDLTRVKEGGLGEYWLRSRNSELSDAISTVYTDGNIYSYYFPNYAKVGASPAMNIDLDMVLFTSEYNKSKADSFSKVKESTTNEWKLTIKASDTGLSATTESATTFYVDQATTDDRILNLTHTAATASLNMANQVSAALTDAVGNVMYYGKVNADIEATSSTIEVPNDLETGNYNLYVFAEQVNDATKTDYASALGTPITLTVKNTENAATYTVTVVNGAGSGDYEVGEKVEIRADMAQQGKQFKKWEVTTGPTVKMEDEMSAVTSFEMPAEAVVVTALYEDITNTSATGDLTKMLWFVLVTVAVVVGTFLLIQKKRLINER